MVLIILYTRRFGARSAFSEVPFVLDVAQGLTFLSCQSPALIEIRKIDRPARPWVRRMEISGRIHGCYFRAVGTISHFGVQGRRCMPNT